MALAQINPSAFLLQGNGNGSGPSASQALARRQRQKLVAAGSQAPSARDMNSLVWELASSIGGPTPFSARRIPLQHCYEMRTDAVIALTMLFARMPLLSARWHIECKSARKAQFLTEAIKQIYGRFVLQWTTKWEFGWQAMVKRFVYEAPDWTFIDRADPNGKPQKVWPDGPKNPAMVWDNFVPLKPETVTPRWNSDGTFGGINLSQGFGGYSFPTIIEVSDGSKGSALTDNQRRYVDLDHSLWAVNNRDNTFGSVWGYPRLGFSFKYWWAYEMLLGILYRSTERKADPSVKVDYPDAYSIDASGARKHNRELAFEIGQNARSGSVLAIPSERYFDADDRPSHERMWDVSYLTGGEGFKEIVEVLSYLDTMKIRSQLTPEQALTEGKGGTSSRNVAESHGEQGQRMAIAAMTELASDFNELMIPQLSEHNFPELRGSPARMVFKDLGAQDLELYAQLLQAASNKEGSLLPIDYEAMADHLNIPTLSPEQIAAREAQMAKEAATRPTPAVEAKPGGNAGVTDTGFYYEAPDLLAFADDEVLLASLPDSKHFKDSAVLATTRLIRKLMKERYAEQYEHFAAYLESGDVELDDDLIDEVELAEKNHRLKCPECGAVQSARNSVCKDCGHDLTDARKAKFAKLHDDGRLSDDAFDLLLADSAKQKIAKQIMAGWEYTSDRGRKIVNRVTQAFETVFSRAGQLELKGARLSTNDWKPSEKDLKDWISKNAAAMVTSVDATTRNELKSFLLKQMEEDKNAADIAGEVRKHFSDFPGWKADRVARTEVSKVYNAATLFAGQSAGVRQVQALDARHGATDADCEDRNGRLYSIEDAFRESAKEHPWGTLAWRYIKGAELSIVRVDEGESPEYMAHLDQDNRIIYLRKDLDTERAGYYLAEIGQYLECMPALAPELAAAS